MKFKFIEEKSENTKSKYDGSRTAFNKVTKLGISSKKLVSKLSLKASDKNFKFNELEEEICDIDEQSTSKNLNIFSKKNTIMDQSTQGLNKSNYTTTKKHKTHRLYGILGVDKLNPDDNILMRGNINSKKENSLSLATTYITKTALREDKAMFYSHLGQMETKINKGERDLIRKRRMNNTESVKIIS